MRFKTARLRLVFRLLNINGYRTVLSGSLVGRRRRASESRAHSESVRASDSESSSDRPAPPGSGCGPAWPAGPRGGRRGNLMQ